LKDLQRLPEGFRLKEEMIAHAREVVASKRA
jgi:hypothetical protein